MLGNYNEKNAKTIIDYCTKVGFNRFAIAGILANWYHESLLDPNNAQDGYMNTLHMTDDQYTAAVDSDVWIHPATGKTFATDSIGYGLAQWTSSGRKAGLLELARANKTSINNINTQLAYFYKEISSKSYKSLLDKLMNATDEKEAAINFMVYYERPASVDNESARNGRASTASEFYKKYFVNSEVDTGYLMTSYVFIQKLIQIARDYKTLYVLGTWGWPATANNKSRAISKKAYNATTARKNKINAATPDTFFFDCAGLVKGILWGWSGDPNRVYGGAGYACNGVPDSAKLIALCKDVSTDFSNIIPGELLYLPGDSMAHVGVYIGDGQVVECTPIWKDGVQITWLKNIGYTSGNSRMWYSHGKLPWIDYSSSQKEALPANLPKNTETEKEEIFESDPVMYTVVRGDTLSKIANKFSTTVNELVATNHITNPNVIRVGQKLIIKGTAKKETENQNDIKIYIVRKGDTLSQIARKFNTTVVSIAAKNKILNPNKISVGQVITI